MICHMYFDQSFKHSKFIRLKRAYAVISENQSSGADRRQELLSLAKHCEALTKDSTQNWLLATP